MQAEFYIRGIRANWNQIFPILITGAAFFFFVISTVNYRSEYWFPWLITSRILMGFAAIGLMGYLAMRPAPYSWLDTAYLTLCLAVQASHGILERASSIEFYQYTGFFYVAAALSYKGSFPFWVKRFFPVQLVLVLLPLALKERVLHHSLPQIIDIYSFTIVSLFIGTVLARLSATKHDALIANLKLQQELVKEASQVAHDICSPLSSMQVALGYLEGVESSDTKFGDTVNLLQLSAKRLKAIADNLLQKYRREKPPEKNAPLFSVHSLLDELIGEFGAQERYSGIKFIKKYHTEDIPLAGDAARLQRAFGNLIKNGMEAMYFNGSITVETEKRGTMAVVRIADTGPGLSEEKLKQVLAGGFTDGKAEGYGIGTKVVRETVESFGGSWTGKSSQGHGTVFSIELPIASGAGAPIPSFTVAVEGNAAVVIDDDAGMRKQWEMILGDQGVKAKTYACYEEAEEDRFSALTAIIDHHFENSEWNGLQVISRLREGGVKNLYLCTAEYWKPSIQKAMKEMGVLICPKPLPKIIVQGSL